MAGTTTRPLGLSAGLIAVCVALWAAPVAAGGQIVQAPASSPALASNGAVREDTCSRLNRRFDAAFGHSAAKPPLTRLKALRRAAARVGEDPAGCVRDRIIGIERAARSELVRLFADDDPIAASSIARCGRLDENLRCAGWTADDASPLGELSAPAPLADGVRLRLALWPGFQPRGMDVYARPAGASTMQRLHILRGGSIDWRERRDGDLIVVIKEMAGDPVTKYVWTLRFGLSP